MIGISCLSFCEIQLCEWSSASLYCIGVTLNLIDIQWQATLDCCYQIIIPTTRTEENSEKYNEFVLPYKHLHLLLALELRSQNIQKHVRFERSAQFSWTKFNWKAIQKYIVTQLKSLSIDNMTQQHSIQLCLS